MRNKAFAKLITDHGGVVPAGKAQSAYAIAGTALPPSSEALNTQHTHAHALLTCVDTPNVATSPTQFVVRSEFILASIAAGKRQVALGPRDPVTGLPVIGYAWRVRALR